MLYISLKYELGDLSSYLNDFDEAKIHFKTQTQLPLWVVFKTRDLHIAHKIRDQAIWNRLELLFTISMIILCIYIISKKNDRKHLRYVQFQTNYTNLLDCNNTKQWAVAIAELATSPSGRRWATVFRDLFSLWPGNQGQRDTSHQTYGLC